MGSNWLDFKTNTSPNLSALIQPLLEHAVTHDSSGVVNSQPPTPGDLPVENKTKKTTKRTKQPPKRAPPKNKKAKNKTELTIDNFI